MATRKSKRKPKRKAKRNQKRKRRVSLRGKTRNRFVECILDCPAKGRVEVRLWSRKGETRRETCERGLRTKVRIDKPQIPLCKTLRMRDLD